MRVLYWAVLAAVVSATAACCDSYLLVQVPAVSMSVRSAENQRATSLGPVNVRYCSGDPTLASQDASVGLMDEAIAKAEQQTGASYIADARFTAECGCLSLQGVAMKLEGAGRGPRAQRSTPSAAPHIVDGAALSRSFPRLAQNSCRQVAAR